MIGVSTGLGGGGRWLGVQARFAYGKRMDSGWV
eukprot:CAMPEP_0119336152 /NCGR_PEP_ID=MMETSP1333-20130426/91242_1 /TAXON_ID=418940 /ORGANISM="Scyphosphaera apsteinii, Strain RCC1455" /LENGTH=32 /DNA_ID= /DNA_START= /DNA_END= /DNA_ORIENTATION=